MHARVNNVQGCDGSVLLDQTPSGSNTEKKAINNIGLDGFSLVDTIKSKLGTIKFVPCWNMFTCWDITIYLI